MKQGDREGLSREMERGETWRLRGMKQRWRGMKQGDREGLSREMERGETWRLRGMKQRDGEG
jgi:hypothetical protein